MPLDMNHQRRGMHAIGGCLPPVVSVGIHGHVWRACGEGKKGINARIGFQALFPGGC